MSEYPKDWASKPRVTRALLGEHLHILGLRPGIVVLVHSSLSRLGNVEGGAETVVDALCNAVAPGGTVLFPIFTGSEWDGPAQPPRIDVRASPGWTGRIPETARQRPDALRSLHPTHSIVALGADAEWYTSDHERSASPCDEHSPFGRLISENGAILLLGVDQSSNTSLHAVEELAHVPYHLQKEITECEVIDRQGVRHTVHNRLHRWDWPRSFSKVDEPLRVAGAMVMGHVGEADARLIQAGLLAATLLPILRDDPLFLLTTAARLEWMMGINRS